jgi:hypothetical protein
MRTDVVFIFGLTSMVAAPQAIFAAAANYDAIDLAQGKIDLGNEFKNASKGKTVEFESLKLKNNISCLSGFKITAGILEPTSRKACAEFWDQPHPAAGDLTFKLAGAPQAPHQLTVSEPMEIVDGPPLKKFDSGTATLIFEKVVGPQGRKLAFFLPDPDPDEKGTAWQLGKIAADTKTATISLTLRTRMVELEETGGTVLVVPEMLDNTVIQPRGKKGFELKFQKTAAPSRVVEMTPQADFACADYVKNLENKEKLIFGKYMCIDAASTSEHTPLQGETRPGGNIVPPNTSVLVVVRHHLGTQADVSMDGTPGLFLAEERDNMAHGGTEQTETFRVKHRLFVARLPGNANIHVTIKQGKQVLDQGVFELFVETTYIGALRVGLSPVFFDAVDRQYRGTKLPGSDVAEVTRAGNAVTDLEVVVGYAAFLDGLLSSRPFGRSYSSSHNIFAPFVGMGLLATANGGLDAFKSIHLGLEAELTPNFSIAVTGVIRRVTRLTEDVHIGSPLANASEVPTTARAGFGVGLVLNVSPELFRFGKIL